MSKTTTILLFTAAIVCVFVVERAYADCTDEHIVELHKKGKNVRSIARICDMSQGDVQDALQTDDSGADSEPPTRRGGQNTQSSTQPAGGYYCCDAWGNSRCVINNGPLPLGTSCGCWGQGYGVVCR